ncbi:glutathione-independent glyoxalase DJR-1.1-like, partial [Diaphorina citri]|uniref:Glutathione-independent glyoxalase DJR-1.1-like n=1 Tax=Diaphorina citri TaxID=121845 RepID=A0A1S3CX43_DIACI
KLAIYSTFQKFWTRHKLHTSLIVSCYSPELKTNNFILLHQINVVAASVNSALPHVECSRGIKILPDLPLEEALKKGPYDILVLPGGLKGAETFAKDENVGKLLQQYESEGRKVAAICAAPTALKQHGVFKAAKLTSYPAFKEELSAGGYPYSDKNVVVSGE